jgi:alpha-D-ribose 1-methylphosphonate 5-triphosphate synthase subunit PhnG
LASGEVGHGYVQGRRKEDAEKAALIDAMMQTDQAAELQAKVLSPLSKSLADVREQRARKAAATKVDFFTMARGED